MKSEQIKPLKIGELTARLPIIQGGMGVGVSLSSLAGAVAAAGGLGVISTAQIGFCLLYTSPFCLVLKAFRWGHVFCWQMKPGFMIIIRRK